MSIEELDNIIKSMENTTSEFKKYSVVYDELSKLQRQISDSVNDLRASQNSIGGYNASITENTDFIKNQIKELTTSIEQNREKVFAGNENILNELSQKTISVLEQINNLKNENISLNTKMKEFANNNCSEIKDSVLKAKDELTESTNNKIEELQKLIEKKSKRTILISIVSILSFIMNIVVILLLVIK